MMGTVTAAIADPKSKVMIPLGVIAAALVSVLVWLEGRISAVEQQAAEPSARTLDSIQNLSDTLDSIDKRLMRIEGHLMK